MSILSVRGQGFNTSFFSKNRPSKIFDTQRLRKIAKLQYRTDNGIQSLSYYFLFFLVRGRGVSRASTNHLLLCELMNLCDVLPYNLTLSQLQKNKRQKQTVLNYPIAVDPVRNYSFAECKKGYLLPRFFLH